MAKEDKIVFCTGGGCTAKLGAGVLSHILEKLPRGEKDPDLLVGYDSRDDAAVYRITDDIALVQTVDFFPPMVDDPYTFGQIAAANALSDVYAMGGEVKTALNLVCFPESMDLNILGEILRGGAEKVAEAGGILAGGHSIADTGVKYGLSVTGLVDPRRLTANDTGKPGDKLILTKALGVGLICTANRVGEAAPGAMDAAVASMTTLNKSAAEISRSYDVHAATDVTGFSFLGHLHEMMGGRLSCRIDGSAVPVLPGAWQAADDCLYTAAGQRNRNHTGPFVRFEEVPFPMEEILFDPQTSGGLLMAVDPADADALLAELTPVVPSAQRIGTVREYHGGKRIRQCRVHVRFRAGPAQRKPHSALGKRPQCFVSRGRTVQAAAGQDAVLRFQRIGHLGVVTAQEVHGDDAHPTIHVPRAHQPDPGNIRKAVQKPGAQRPLVLPQNVHARLLNKAQGRLPTVAAGEIGRTGLKPVRQIGRQVLAV